MPRHCPRCSSCWNPTAEGAEAEAAEGVAEEEEEADR